MMATMPANRATPNTKLVRTLRSGFITYLLVTFIVNIPLWVARSTVILKQAVETDNRHQTAIGAPVRFLTVESSGRAFDIYVPEGLGRKWALPTDKNIG